jgi:hypothetical protein
MKKAPIKGGQLVTNTTEVKKGGHNQGRGFVSSNPTPITMGVGSKSGSNATMKTKRRKAY